MTTDYTTLSAPEIDAHITRACTRYFRERGECPRLCLVHPLWWKQTFLRAVHIAIPWTPSGATLFREGGPADFRGPEHVCVELLPFKDESRPPRGEDTAREEHWVLPLGRADILRLMEDEPTLGLPPGMTMASLMHMSEAEQAHLECHRFEERHRDTFENWFFREFYSDWRE